MVEFYAMRLNSALELVDELHIIMKPPIRIPEETTKIHGISNLDVAKRKPFAAHWMEIARFFEGQRYLVGHNLQYDKNVLYHELNRINKVTNFPWPIRNICTVEETVKWKGHRMTLTDLHVELFGQAFDKAHSAGADTLALVRVYKELVNRQIVEAPNAPV